MQKLISYFFFDFNLKSQTLYFKRLLYCFLMVKCLYWLCFYDVLFGANSIVFSKPYPVHSISGLAFYLYGLPSATAAYYFIVPVLILSVLNLISTRFYFLSDLIIWLLMVNLHNKIYSTLTGGDYLLNQFLFFNCFLSARFIVTQTQHNSLKLFLHNMGVVAMLVQVCLVYFLSGLAKLGDHNWLSGKAVFLISQVNHFSMYAFPVKAPEFLFVILNYGVLIYQVTFPLFIWLKPVKKQMILIGILMHLYIAFVMGLTGFGVIMIISYVYFWPFKNKLR